jgi:hypothetical protein
MGAIFRVEWEWIKIQKKNTVDTIGILNLKPESEFENDPITSQESGPPASYLTSSSPSLSRSLHLHLTFALWPQV